MAEKALKFMMEESEINEMKKVASVFNMTASDFIKEAVKEYLIKLKEEPLYHLTACAKEADTDESAEILEAIESLSDGDLSIAYVKRFNF